MAATYTVGQVLPSGATVVTDVYTVGADGTSDEVMTDSKGNVTILIVPGLGTPLAVQATVTANIATRQAQVAAWIAANPGGAVLTAAQTLTLAQMLNGLGKLLLQQFASTTGT